MEIKIRKRIHQGQEKISLSRKIHQNQREPHKGTILRTQVTTKNKYRYRTVRRKYTAED
jgi:hypothetical protein